jgi:hypothetical protein
MDSYSEDESSDDDSDSDESSDDYDGEYESVTTSSDEESEENEVVAAVAAEKRSRIPAADAAAAASVLKSNRNRQQQQRSRRRHSTSDDEDTSTEVGSDDLSSDDDTTSEEEEEKKKNGKGDNSGSDFTSGSATECEFTDSEGRPNPFHKQLEIPNIVVEPGSPIPAVHRKGVVIDHVVMERPVAPAQKMIVTSNEGGGGISSMTYDSKLQYKTPNVTDRLKSEQKKDKDIKQDFSTRRALNAKKNWVGDEPKPLNNTGSGGRKNSEAALAEIDNRLKSLMDRLSSQQKLLKPAEKHSAEMQHFLNSTNLMQGSSSSSAIFDSSGGGANGSLMSPTAIRSPPAAPDSSRHPPSLRFYQGALPKVYRSMSNEQNNVVTKPTSSSLVASVQAASKAKEEEEEKAKAVAAAASGSNSAFEEVESIVVPDLPKEEEKKDESGGSSASDDYETEEEEDVKEEEVGKKENIIISQAVNSVLTVTAPGTAPNESSSFGDEFESCNEGEESLQTNGLAEAVNLALTNASANIPYLTPATGLDVSSPSNEVIVPDRTPLLPLPLATSSPYTSMDQRIDFIDNSVADSTPSEPTCSPPPAEMVFDGEEITGIFREKDHKSRLARLTNYRQKEKSVVHDLIMARRPNNRSSSAAARSRRVLPSTGHPSSRPPPPPPNEEAATTPRRVPPPPKRQESAPPPKPSLYSKSKIEQMDFLLIDEDDSVQLRKGSKSSAPSTPLKLPATPLSDPEKFGIRRNVTAASPSRSRYDTSTAAKRPTSLNTKTASSGSNSANASRVTTSLSEHSLLASPTNSNASNDFDYMDGGILSADSSPSKSASTNSAGKKRTFMKTISGIFNRSSSLSSVARNHPIPASTATGSSGGGGSQREVRPAAVLSSSSGAAAAASSSSSTHRFPRIGFRSNSAHRDANKNHHQNNSSPDSPSGKAPRADISELGSLASLGSNSTATPKREPTGPGHLFRTASLTLQASHPSTPPVPLSRKITLGSACAPNFRSGSDGSLNSENEENESPDDEEDDDPSFNRREQEKIKKTARPTVPPEILDKILHRGGKAAKRVARVARLKRVRKAQEIQRQLEELDVHHRELEERGVKAEKTIRGETTSDMSDADLMRTWFQLLSEKNRLVRREQELLVQAKQLELEDVGATLESELREHLALDSRSPESVVREGKVLKELLEISEQREKLQAMMDKDRARYQREDRDIEAQMRAKGIAVPSEGGMATPSSRRRQLAAS